MIIHSKDRVRGTLIDLTSKKVIPKAIWFDDETGEYEAFRLDPSGKIATENGVPLRYKGKSKLRFVPSSNTNQKFMEKVAPEKMQDTVNLGKRIVKREAILFPCAKMRCQHYGCDRIAAWSVSDEEHRPPIVINGRCYEQAATLRERYYCSWHYVPPKLYDAKGELIEVDNEAGGVRPQ